MRTCDRKLQADESCQHRFATLINGFYTCTAHSYLFYFYIFEVDKKAVRTMFFLWVEGEKVIKCAAKQRFGSSKISRFSHLANHVCIDWSMIRGDLWWWNEMIFATVIHSFWLDFDLYLGKAKIKCIFSGKK